MNYRIIILVVSSGGPFIHELSLTGSEEKIKEMCDQITSDLGGDRYNWSVKISAVKE